MLMASEHINYEQRRPQLWDMKNAPNCPDTARCLGVFLVSCIDMRSSYSHHMKAKMP